MTREELKALVRKISHAYGNRFAMTQDIFDTWYDMLSGIDYKIGDSVLSEFIARSEYPPTIADIACGDKEHRAAEMKKTAECRQLIDAIRRLYPLASPESAFDVVFEDFTVGDAKRRLERLYGRVRTYVKKCESDGVDVEPLDVVLGRL